LIPKRLIAPVGTHLVSGAREQWVVTLALTPLSLLLSQPCLLSASLATAVAIPLVTLVLTTAG
jgi:competence protein ComEC